jgi:hypothetical protein
MSATVYLDVFSGLPNPQWKLGDADYSELLRRLTSLRTGPLEPNYEAAEWGYKGMVIKSPGRPTIRIAAGVEAKWGSVQIANRRGTFVDVERSIEPWLLERATGMADKYGLTFAELTRARNETTIKGLDQAAPIGGFACPTGVSFPPSNQLETWKESSSNCYNYANNQKANGGLPAVPGPNNKVSWTPDEMRHAAIVRDKLELVSMDGHLPAVCPDDPKSHYVVICLRDPLGNAAFTDFHCLRLDKDGRWSHKDGAGPVRPHDDIQSVITDLRTASFKIPLTFVGFFLSTKGRRRIS